MTGESRSSDYKVSQHYSQCLVLLVRIKKFLNSGRRIEGEVVKFYFMLIHVINIPTNRYLLTITVLIVEFKAPIHRPIGIRVGIGPRRLNGPSSDDTAKTEPCVTAGVSGYRSLPVRRP